MMPRSERGAKRGPKLSEAEFRRLWADLSVSVAEIGRRLGISGNAVKQRAKVRNLPDRPKGRPFARVHDHDRIVALYRSGLSMIAVARVMGCTLHNVLMALRRAGVPSRDRKDPKTTGSLMCAALAIRAAEEQRALHLAGMVDGPRDPRSVLGRRAA